MRTDADRAYVRYIRALRRMEDEGAHERHIVHWWWIKAEKPRPCLWVDRTGPVKDSGRKTRKKKAFLSPEELNHRRKMDKLRKQRARAKAQKKDVQ